MSHTSRSQNFLWMSLALLPLIGISFLLAIPPQDYWWVLRVGQDTIQSGAIPTTDLISLSQFGQPIVYQTWLSGVIFYLVYQLGGTTLTFLLRGILIGAAYGIVWGMAREASNARLATVLVITMGLASGNNWAMRSQLFAYPLFALALWSLFKWQNDLTTKTQRREVAKDSSWLGVFAPFVFQQSYLWILPLVALLWANLHGSFILPIILAGIALIFGKGERKPLAITLVIMLLATLVNPRGFGAWRYLVFMLNSPSDQLFAAEWAAPRNQGWQMNIFFAWMILFAPLASLSPRKLSAFEWILFLAFGWLALTGLRYVIWFLFIVAILTSGLLYESLKALTQRLKDAKSQRFFFESLSLRGFAAEKQPKQNFSAINIAFGILMLSASLIFLRGIREKWMGDSIPIYEMSTSPVAATKWLDEHPELEGALFSDYAFGGYFSFNLQSRRPWMDSRFNAFPPEQWTEYAQVSRAENWQAMFDREKINLLALSTASQPKLIQAVENSKAWCERYRDQYAVIFARCNK
ncbi:MAG: hypothetical protein PHQ36_01340 [Anaerolineales bacterium]|nr:hypothetical protein [Anaerolineales bacterium]